jgi:hypothetical protein
MSKKYILLIKSLLFLITLIILNSCSNDNEDDLTTPVSPSDPDEPITVITYKDDVKNIMSNNCITCHAAGGSQEVYPLETYNQVKNAALSGKLYNRMTNASNPMPPSGILPGTVTKIIEDWINDGLLEE